MSTDDDRPRSSTRLRTATVLRAREDTCDVVTPSGPATVGFAPFFPAPRVERVHPGNLVAIATGPTGTAAVVWRWFDAVVLGRTPDGPRLWEPAHGEVVARPRRSGWSVAPGHRAHLSAGLPGAEWWVCGEVAATVPADVELAEVARFLTEHGLWALLG